MLPPFAVPPSFAPVAGSPPLPSLPPARFDNRFVRELPGDASGPAVPRQTPGVLWATAFPTQVAAPRLLAHSPEVAALLGIAASDVESPAFAEVFGGNLVVPGMQPCATCYGGHQFGHWAGQLGDGRAILLGEIHDVNGQRQELQLKGAGRTPYARGADGRAVLRSSLREFVCSEAMAHLGVPTTRALSLVATGDRVMRDMFYDGRPQFEPGAVVCRVAPSLLRLGHFQLPAARGDHALLLRLLDFAIDRDYSHLTGDPAQRRTAFFHEVCARTATLMADWMRVGFVHGVMNTDNLSILGLTIDYGPYGWLEAFEPGWTPNTTDAAGRRYCYGRQPMVAQWNLERFAEALSAVLPEPDLVDGLHLYARTFTLRHRLDITHKLGWEQWQQGDEITWQTLQDLLEQGQLDFTAFFRQLSMGDAAAVDAQTFAPLSYDAEAFAAIAGPLQAWLAHWRQRVAHEALQPYQRQAAMASVNPRYVPRNWLAQEAIEAATAGDLAPLHTLLDVLRQPYTDQAGRDHYAGLRPEWARHKPGCAMLSCSS